MLERIGCAQTRQAATRGQNPGSPQLIQTEFGSLLGPFFRRTLLYTEMQLEFRPRRKFYNIKPLNPAKKKEIKNRLHNDGNSHRITKNVFNRYARVAMAAATATDPRIDNNYNLGRPVTNHIKTRAPCFGLVGA